MNQRARNESGRLSGSSLTLPALGRRRSISMCSRRRSASRRGEIACGICAVIAASSPPAIGDRSTRRVLRRTLIDLGQASRAGARWLHHLRDRPDVLRKLIDRALAARVLYDDPGRLNGFERVVFAEGVGRAYPYVTDDAIAGRSVAPGG